jgi:hypothetical protein
MTLPLLNGHRHLARSAYASVPGHKLHWPWSYTIVYLVHTRHFCFVWIPELKAVLRGAAIVERTAITIDSVLGLIGCLRLYPSARLCCVEK